MMVVGLVRRSVLPKAITPRMMRNVKRRPITRWGITKRRTDVGPEREVQ
jgi:hypothetical protein